MVQASGPQNRGPPLVEEMCYLGRRDRSRNKRDVYSSFLFESFLTFSPIREFFSRIWRVLGARPTQGTCVCMHVCMCVCICVPLPPAPRQGDAMSLHFLDKESWYGISLGGAGFLIPSTPTSMLQRLSFSHEQLRCQGSLRPARPHWYLLGSSTPGMACWEYWGPISVSSACL